MLYLFGCTVATPLRDPYRCKPNRRTTIGFNHYSTCARQVFASIYTHYNNHCTNTAWILYRLFWDWRACVSTSRGGCAFGIVHGENSFVTSTTLNVPLLKENCCCYKFILKATIWIVLVTIHIVVVTIHMVFVIILNVIRLIMSLKQLWLAEK